MGIENLRGPISGLYKGVPNVHVADNAVARRLLDVSDVSRHVLLLILESKET